MKIKKIYMFIFVLLAIFLAGCGNQNTEIAVAKNIDKNANRLDSIIQKLDNMNYDDIIIEDINPLQDNTFNTTNNAQTSKMYDVVNNRVVNVENLQKNNLYSTRRLTNNTANTFGSKNEEYTQNVIKPSYYTPKYVNQTSSSFTDQNLTNYINKIENLYKTCADCISCNTECRNETSNLKQNINDCKVLSNKLKDGTIKLSNEEITECNNCLDNLFNLSNRLASTKDNLMLKEKEIINLKDNFSKNIDNLQVAYEKLLTALESRLEYLQTCNKDLCVVCDIINKTNVDFSAVEENRSNEKDIIYDTNTNNEDRNIVNNNQNNFDNQSYNSNNIENNQKYNVNNVKNNQTTKNPNMFNNQTQNLPINQNMNNANNQNMNNPTNQNYVNGYPNNQYGYGYNYGYPYRNIDTYRTITRNTDTYSPNYYPNIGQNYNNQYFQNTMPTAAQTENESENNINNDEIDKNNGDIGKPIRSIDEKI